MFPTCVVTWLDLPLGAVVVVVVAVVVAITIVVSGAVTATAGVITIRCDARLNCPVKIVKQLNS